MRNLFSYGFVRLQCGPVGGEIKITLWAITVAKMREYAANSCAAGRWRFWNGPASDADRRPHLTIPARCRGGSVDP